MPDTLEHQWEPYARLVPFETIDARLEFPKPCLPEEVRFLLPSVGLAKDGPVVHSLFLVTEKYLCEVRLNQNTHGFDVALLATIRNYRIEAGKQEITLEDPASGTHPATEKQVTTITYDTAKIHLSHAIHFRTELTYVGDRRDAWIRDVLTAFPIDLLVQSAQRTVSDGQPAM